MGVIQKFNLKKEYGFIRIKEMNVDLFFHLNEFKFPVYKNLFLDYYRNRIYLRFSCLKYMGKYSVSYKATDIEFL